MLQGYVGIKLGGCLTLNHSTGALGFSKIEMFGEVSPRDGIVNPPVVIQNFPNTWRIIPISKWLVTTIY